MRVARGGGQLGRKTGGHRGRGNVKKFDWNKEELRDMRGQDDII